MYSDSLESRLTSIESSPEKEDYLDRAVFMIKPDGMTAQIEGCSFKELLYELIYTLDLKIVDRKIIRLSEKGLRVIYDNLNQPSEFGDQWKYDIITHITGGDIEACVVVGDGASEKMNNLKRSLREKFTNRSTLEGKIVKNLLHVADPDEYEITYKALFEGEE